MLCAMVLMSFRKAAPVDDLYRQRLLLDVEDAEETAMPFVRDIKGLDKLLVPDSFYGFGGLSDAPALSHAGVDKMPLGEKKVWLACRLWAICRKIRNMNNPPAQAGIELARYSHWLAHPERHAVTAGRQGGSKSRPYSSDLDKLIRDVIRREAGRQNIHLTVFNQLPGASCGIIEKITKDNDNVDGTEFLKVYWEGDKAEAPDKTETFKFDSIRKRVNRILKESRM